MKIIQEREKCIGCGTCAALCPKFWEISEDGKANLIKGKKNGANYERDIIKPECNEQAAQNCPVQCIKIED